MSADLKLHHLPPSPNNVRVRLALGYKGLEYESLPYLPDGFPGDRSRIVAASTQPRLPVLEHGAVRLFDSYAILRYLDANFPDTPRLYSEDYGEMADIEGWERFARTQLGEVVGMMFSQAMAPQLDEAVLARANALLIERTADVEARLGEGPFLLGERLTAADLASVPLAALGAIPESAAGKSPVVDFFRANLSLGEERERTREWIGRVLAYDGFQA